MTHKKLKILYIVPHKYFFSNFPLGRVTHVLGICNGLKKNNVEIEIISEQGIDKFKKRIDQNIKSITINNKKNRIYFFIEILKQIRSMEYDFFFVRHEPLFLFLCLFLPKKIRNKFIVELNGFGFDVSPGMKRYLSYFVALIYDFFLRPFGKIVAVNKSIKKRLSDFNKLKTIVVENGGPSLTVRKFKDGQVSHRLDYVFYGALQPYVDLGHIFNAFDLLHKGNFQFNLNFIGFGPELDKLKVLCKDREWASYLGSMDYDDFKSFIFNYPHDLVALIPMGIKYGESDLKPIKLFEYLSLSLPLIYADCVASDIFEDRINGFKYKSGDSKSLFSSLKESIENKDIIMNSIEKNKILYSSMTWEHRMKKMLEEI